VGSKLQLTRAIGHFDRQPLRRRKTADFQCVGQMNANNYGRRIVGKNPGRRSFYKKLGDGFFGVTPG